MRSMDDYDDEVRYQRDEKLKVGVLFSFKSMSLIIGRIVEETKEIDDKYPKSELLKIWGCAMGMFFVLFLFSYSGLIAATVPFMMFYGYVLIQIVGAWKRFKYPKAQIIWGTIGALLAELAVALLLQSLILW